MIAPIKYYGLALAISCILVAPFRSPSFAQTSERLPQSDLSLLTHETAGIDIRSVATADTLCNGARLFTDRDYLALELPKEIRGAKFLRASIDGVEFTVLQSGWLAALTPLRREGAASQEAELTRLGFERERGLEFQLFPGAVNRVQVFTKHVEGGETYRFGKWVIPIFGPRSRVYTLGGQTLPNGIVLPAEWPPKTQNPMSDQPMQVPYLTNFPRVVVLSGGRQLFVDDFLIAETTMKRVFHIPKKFAGNPILAAQSEVETKLGAYPAAAVFGDGVFADPATGNLMMWYQAGWSGGTALAISQNGITWDRPDLDVVPGTNLVLPNDPLMRRDGVTVWIDHDAEDPGARFKMLLYTRYGALFGKMREGEGHLLSSRDGIHWTFRRKVPTVGDNNTFFYNPFRRRWVFALKTGVRGQRAREYWESEEFFSPDAWKVPRPTFWLASDRLDRPDPAIGDTPQLYKLEGVAYESLLIGLFQMHYGPDNFRASSLGSPKITDLQVGFSRDGFHWHRPSRIAFIPAARSAGSWERGYVTAAAGVLIVAGDELLFYYSAFAGDGSKRGGDYWSGMYANGATGLAILRRDGFASMDAGEHESHLQTRLFTHEGRWLFANADAERGAITVEVLDATGRVIPGFSRSDCVPLTSNSTRHRIQWLSGADLAAFQGQQLQLRFWATNAAIYSFWISKWTSGESEGYLGAGELGTGRIKDIPR